MTAMNSTGPSSVVPLVLTVSLFLSSPVSSFGTFSHFPPTITQIYPRSLPVSSQSDQRLPPWRTRVCSPYVK
ncbi:hypothetical protein QBC43DRAFT_308693 [Cladorrhinum sp. PSN259]|nr:hypothetical protein QBC43DRAFT_308693 [Cladorrhinum sp. PSN259]